MLTKNHILTALRVWINQRPGLNFGNYGDISAYRSELRQITRDRREALILLRAIALRFSITAEQIIAAFPRAYSGRLSISEVTNKAGEPAAKLDYCVGQHWPTEYRKAAAAVLALVLRDYFRDYFRVCMPALDGKTPGDWLRNTAKREFGSSIQARWFQP